MAKITLFFFLKNSKTFISINTWDSLQWIVLNLLTVLSYMCLEELDII